MMVKTLRLLHTLAWWIATRRTSSSKYNFSCATTIFRDAWRAQGGSGWSQDQIFLRFGQWRWAQIWHRTRFWCLKLRAFSYNDIFRCRPGDSLRTTMFLSTYHSTLLLCYRMTIWRGDSGRILEKIWRHCWQNIPTIVHLPCHLKDAFGSFAWFLFPLLDALSL